MKFKCEECSRHCVIDVNEISDDYSPTSCIYRDEEINPIWEYLKEDSPVEISDEMLSIIADKIIDSGKLGNIILDTPIVKEDEPVIGDLVLGYG